MGLAGQRAGDVLGFFYGHQRGLASCRNLRYGVVQPMGSAALQPGSAVRRWFVLLVRSCQKEVDDMNKTRIFSQFINGSFTESSGHETFTTINPATNEVLGVVAQASESDIESAIASAQKAFLQWRGKTGAERGRVLVQAARILRSRCPELAHLEMQDVGKPISATL